VSKSEFKFFYEKYISEEALNHVDGKIADTLKTERIEDDPDLKQTNEEVRRNINVNLFSMALNLRKTITEYDAKNKYRLFLVSLIVTSSIIILTYANALTQNIMHTGNFVNILKIISTILGFKYIRSADTCLANDLSAFICLFLLLAYDVYVIRVITALQKEINQKLKSIESVDRDTADNLNALIEPDPVRLARRSIMAMRKNSEGSDEGSDTDQDFRDLRKLEVGIEKSVDLVKSYIKLFEVGDGKGLELDLLDEQDKQEIRIKALRFGSVEDLVKYTTYDSLAELDLKRWNFYEFYIVAKHREEDKFRVDLPEMTKNKGRLTDTDSESNDGEQNESEGEVQLFKEEDEKKKEIVSLTYIVPQHD
jgi:hypothetical protein